VLDGVTSAQEGDTHWLQLRYRLIISSVAIGELLLVLDESLAVIDENWWVDVRSPFVIMGGDRVLT
jgi:hypothetical protein